MQWGARRSYITVCVNINLKAICPEKMRMGGAKRGISLFVISIALAHFLKNWG